MYGFDIYGLNFATPYRGCGIQNPNEANRIAFEWGFKKGAKDGIRSILFGNQSGYGFGNSGIYQKLMSMKQGLEFALQNSPDEYKSKLQKKLDEVQKQIDEFEEKANTIMNGTDADPQTAMRAAQVYKDIIIKIGESVQKTLDEVRKEIAEQQKAKQASEQEDDDTTDVDDAADNDDASNGSRTVKVDDKKVDSKTGRPVELGEAPSKSDCRAFCAKLFNAVDGPGTDNDVIKELIPGLNEQNIMEIIKLWDKEYGTGENDMIHRLVEDLGHYQKKEYVPMILNALQTRAEALGIDDDDEICSAVTQINNELGQWNISEGITSRNLRKIADKIAEKEASNVSEAEKTTTENKKKAEDKKAEKETKKADKEKEIINLFISDMREIWKDDKLEKSDKVRYENGKFRIRIEGKEYSGSDFNALVKAVKNAGYDPKKYLSKQDIDTKA